jgi:predicted phage terminase large subunit-like protein
MVLQEYNDYEPDSMIVEKKATGAPLIYELRAMGIPVQEYTPVRGTTNNPNNKMARLNAISDLFASGVVWAPNKSWAEEVIDEVASFPSGEHDDYVDSIIMALMRFRQGGFLRLPSDEKEPDRFFSRKKGGYY